MTRSNNPGRGTLDPGPQDLGPQGRGSRDSTRPAVFLDRDGTMIHEQGYLSRLEDVHWFPGAIDAVRLLKRAGYLVFVVTNQGGIGLGLFDNAFVRQVHESMTTTMAAGGAAIDGWFFCPHHPNAIVETLKSPCECRKPGRAMIDAACASHALDLSKSFVVGDRDVDVQLAVAVGARPVLVRTGHGRTTLERTAAPWPDGTLIVDDLSEAVVEILSA